jgi:hypothetical protein
LNAQLGAPPAAAASAPLLLLLLLLLPSGAGVLLSRQTVLVRLQALE